MTEEVPPRERILLLVSNDRNRELLADRLAAYEVVEHEADGDLPAFDLCVVDGESFTRYRDRLERARAAEAPCVLPVLLVGEPTETEAQLGASEQPIDEILSTPVSEVVLSARVESLLSMRRQSAQLAERNRELAQTNRQLDAFASTVSHDLRNPLNLAMARVRQERDERDSDALAKASDALDRIQELTNELLRLARQGQGIDDPDRVPFAAIAEDSWSMVVPDGARLHVAADFTLVADEVRLRQLLENLFRNAIAHGGADVTVTVGRIEGDRQGFFVEDDGTGVPEANREQVFESGFTSVEEGTGFGLDIVTGIADAHDWEVRLAESSNGGARFEFTGVDIRT